MARLRIEAFFVILLLFVAFICGQRSATSPRSAGGATAPPAQFVVLQAERDREGNLTSPDFPENYPNRSNITWRIEAGNGDVVHLAFDQFDLERPQELNRKCTWDYVAVYDGTNNLKDKFCGKELPPEVSSDTVLSVAFVSDATVSRSGFSARYWASEAEGVIMHVESHLLSVHSEIVSVVTDIPDEFYNYCKDLDYDTVATPNFYDHVSDAEILASRQWQEMKTVNRSCHPQIQLFLCSLLMPRYTTRKELPCQSWCREVKSSCSADGSLFEAINCTSLPITECVNLEPPEDCYYGNGENYRGVGTLPEGSGKECLNWTNLPEYPWVWLFSGYNLDWVDQRENYCRNLGIDLYEEPYCIATNVSDGEKYTFPTPCSLKHCDVLGCGWHPYVQYGSISPVQNFYKVGTKVFISCDVGYVIEDGDMFVTCTGDGTWSKGFLRCTSDHKRQLTDTLLSEGRYSPQLAPSRNQVNVTFEAAVVNIIDVDEKKENVVASIAFRLQWRDNRLSWPPTQYGEEPLVVTTKDVWIPKVFLPQNGDAEFSDFPEAPVTVRSDGLVEWDIIDLLTTTCDLRVALFPFDTMECLVCLGATTRVERFHCPKSDDNRNSAEQNTPINWFIACGEEDVGLENQWYTRWTIFVDEGEFGYGCINMKFDRMPAFQFCTTLFPVIILSLLMCITFVLPIEKGDRISFGMTILLSMVVSLVFITEALPAREHLPVVALLIVVYMCMMGFFLFVTVIVIRISSKDEDLPPLVKKVFLRYVARLVLLGDLTKPTQGHTVLKVDDFEMPPTSMPGNDSKSSEAEPDHLLEVLLSLKESVDNLSNAVETFGTSKPSEATEDEPAKTDYSQLARVLDRLCLILYVFGLIFSIPWVRFSVADSDVEIASIRL